MNLTLTGQHVLVTGASSGLGAHFATLAAREGAAVTLAARRTDRLEALAARLPGLGAAAVQAVALDVTEAASVEAALEAAERLAPLDVLVNNAGIAVTGRAEAQGLDDFDRVLDTNLRGVWAMASGAARLWIAAGRPGVIVNIASILGLRVTSGVAPYAISKAGVVQATQALALEWARHGIRVNALCPGYVETEINAEFFATQAGQKVIGRVPMRRIGQPEDLDGAFLLLASEAGRFITGAALPVDGGHMVAGL